MPNATIQSLMRAAQLAQSFGFNLTDSFLVNSAQFARGFSQSHVFDKPAPQNKYLVFVEVWNFKKPPHVVTSHIFNRVSFQKTGHSERLAIRKLVVPCEPNFVGFTRKCFRLKFPVIRQSSASHRRFLRGVDDAPVFVISAGVRPATPPRPRHCGKPRPRPRPAGSWLRIPPARGACGQCAT